jgi:hypothetical protein
MDLNTDEVKEHIQTAKDKIWFVINEIKDKDQREDDYLAVELIQAVNELP